MSTTKSLAAQDVHKLAQALLAAGTRVLGPTRIGAAPYARIDLGEIHAAEALSLSAPLTPRSLKEAFLPPTEILFRWHQKKSEIELTPAPATFAPTVVLGARPCDAAAVEKLDRVMGWDYKDELWFARREATTIVALTCAGLDPACFCTAVGLGPDSRRGADLLLTPVGSDFHVEVRTPKGEALVQAQAQCFGAKADDAAAAQAQAEARAQVTAHLALEPAAVRTWLQSHFDDPFWKGLALRCHGCGACASVCPTCHCFDIVDEPEGVDAGARRRNWDTCQTAKFSVHGSGHNPRADQSARYRQRVTHKFAIYPKRFGETLCTGCGRCARACPGGMDLPEVLTTIDGLAQGKANSSRGAA